MRSTRAAVVALILAVGGLNSAFAQNATKKKPEAAAAPAHWIWADKEAKDKDTIYLRKTIEFAGAVKSGVLSATCDNVVTIYVNGKQVLKHSEWTSAPQADVGKLLVKGKNVIAAECTNEGGPAGFILLLKTESEKEGKRTIISDSSWEVSREAPEGWREAAFDSSGWKKTVSLGALGAGPWGNIAFDGGKVSATPAAELTLLPGFKAELVYSVPKATEGSWVSMAPDPKGRLIVSDQSGPLYRVSPGPTDEETKVERIDLAIGDSQGMLYAFDALYVVVNGDAAQGSGLYKVRDTDGDD
ncbi:MAG: hypothetical protein ACM3U2_05920, partial [Deltaproteobacteria bacterium]